MKDYGSSWKSRVEIYSEKFLAMHHEVERWIQVQCERAIADTKRAERRRAARILRRRRRAFWDSAPIAIIANEILGKRKGKR